MGQRAAHPLAGMSPRRTARTTARGMRPPDRRRRRGSRADHSPPSGLTAASGDAATAGQHGGGEVAGDDHAPGSPSGARVPLPAAASPCCHSRRRRRTARWTARAPARSAAGRRTRRSAVRSFGEAQADARGPLRRVLGGSALAGEVPDGRRDAPGAPAGDRRGGMARDDRRIIAEGAVLPRAAAVAEASAGRQRHPDAEVAQLARGARGLGTRPGACDGLLGGRREPGQRAVLAAALVHGDERAGRA